MNEHILNVLRHRATIPASVGVVAFAGGAGLGYILGKRRASLSMTLEGVLCDEPSHEDPNQLKFELSTSDIEEISPVNTPRPKPEPVVIESVPDHIHPEPTEGVDETVIVPVVEEEVEPEMVSVFAESGDDWDYVKELASRDGQSPYVLHKDEFWAEEMRDRGFTQTTLTYYEGDDILADEEDTPVYNHSRVTGPLKFGHGSDDPNVVYIRNEERKAEYEILRHSGLYTKEVLDLDIPDNQRAAAVAKRKFRDEPEE